MIIHMILNFMKLIIKICSIALLYNFIFASSSLASLSHEGFKEWLISYKSYALKKGISEKTVNAVFKNAKFLENVMGLAYSYDDLILNYIN